MSQADLLLPHFTSWSRVSVAGGNVVIIGTKMSPSRFHPWFLGSGVEGIGSVAVFHMMH